MDINLLNYSELARRIGVSSVHCHRLMFGIRRSEKRLRQIAGVLGLTLEDLKTQIEKNRLKRFGHTPVDELILELRHREHRATAHNRPHVKAHISKH